MNFSERYERAFRSFLPSPFALAILLTALVLACAVVFFKPAEITAGLHILSVGEMWYRGIWDGPMLVFAMQMMLILVLGHTLALSEPIDQLLRKATLYCDTTPRAAAIVTVICIVAGFINWGLALIAGALLARKIAEVSLQKGIKINYPLIAASGYTGMMVWHGGISGSSLIKVAETGHLEELAGGSKTAGVMNLPDYIGFGETVFSSMNMAAWLALLVILPFAAWSIGKNSATTHYILKHYRPDAESNTETESRAEKLDSGPATATIFGVFVILIGSVIATLRVADNKYNFIDPNFINLGLLGFGLLAHGSLSRFTAAVDQAARGAGSILIQFPLYFGIMGVMKHTGMVSAVSEFIINHSTAGTYPYLTFFAAGLINFFVPSGGGQWMIQGPVIIESARQLGVPLGKSILAMAYGDQITNMMQPFWALPLLAITGLKARDILPYTLYFMIIGTGIFLAAMYAF